MLHHKPQEREEVGSINSLISTVPIALDSTRSEVIEAGNYYLPYSTGFEIECEQGPNFNKEAFTTIPNIMEVIVDSSEQRFRIPSGIEGLKCLYNISEQLKVNSLLNLGSGIHYHIDCTDIYDSMTPEDVKEYKDIILTRLDEWNYKGSYNSRNVGYSHNWIRIQSHFKTMEIRIGEMTFDYELLFKRITDGNDIIRDFKRYVKRRIAIRELTTDLIYELEDYKEVLKHRTKRI